MAIGDRGYSRLLLVFVLAILTVVIVLDHVGSPTFRRNMGEGGVETALDQRESQTAACAPCGAPCREDGEESAE